MNAPTRKLWAVLFILAISLSACAPAAAPTPALTPITVQLRWTHQAQFAGFYAADANGYYAAEGIAVKFIEGGPNIDIPQPVIEGAAQFGIVNAETLILARAENKPVCALATIYRRSPAVFFALAESGIKRPQDFIGKKVRVTTTTEAMLRAMMQRVGIAPSQYTEVKIADILAPLYAGEIDVTSGFITNEVIRARNAGYQLNLIYPDDYGIHFYADTLFTTDALMASDPDLVRRFLRATLKGWTYAVENPTQVAPIVLHYNPKADTTHETAFMTASIPLVNTGEDHIGWMKPEIWAGMEKTLREQDVLTRPVDVTQVYTMQFLKEIYGK